MLLHFINKINSSSYILLCCFFTIVNCNAIVLEIKILGVKFNRHQIPIGWFYYVKLIKIEI